MIGHLRLFADCVLRSFGQFFIANNPLSGLLILLGLMLLSPPHAALALFGAGAITLAAWGLGTSRANLRTGLFGVNGALLGIDCLLLPELSAAQKIVLTVSGSLAMAVFLVPLTAWFSRRRPPLTLFAVPSAMVFWASIALLHTFGMYDRHHLAAWAELAARRPQQAAEYFLQSQERSPRSFAYHADGLGWAAFQEGDYTAARESFQRAVVALPSFADAYDGLGWCCLKLGEFESAEAAFRAAVSHDAWLADSWDGLGWTLLETGDVRDAAICFRSASFSAPLLADAYAGLAKAESLDEPDEAARASRTIAEVIARHAAPRLQYVSTKQLLCWLLFALAIVYHSRISAAATGVAVGCCLLAARWSPAAAAGLADVNCFYNVLALVLALTGHYLRLRPLSILWTAGLGIGMVFAFSRFSLPMTAGGLPPAAFPCSVALVVTLLIARAFDRLGGPKLAVPLEFAVTSPENVRLWVKKCDIAAKCWRKLDAG